MANFGVYLRTITRIDPIPGADAIELATVDGYRCVVAKGLYNVFDRVLYFPTGSVLPPHIITRLGLEGRLAGPNKDRVKEITLRGQLSEGVILRDPTAIREEYDYAPSLGVTKYEPPIPIGFSGQLQAADGRIEPWVEIDAIKSMRSFDPATDTWSDPFHMRQVEATLKVHGTAFACTMHGPESTETGFYVSSKGLGSKGLSLSEDETNVYWRAARTYDLESKLTRFLDISLYPTISVYGEVFGPGVQDLNYGQPGVTFRAFDVKLNGKWCPPATARYICAQLDIPFVPSLYIGPYNFERLLDLAENIPSDVDGLVSKVHEGLVVRAMTGTRRIGKIVSGKYLTRKGGTEYN